VNPLDRARFEAGVVTLFLEWLEPENIDQFLELSRKKDRSLFDLIVTGLRRSYDRPGTTSAQIQEAKQLFTECGLDWDEWGAFK
jgi:hypothetical protein